MPDIPEEDDDKHMLERVREASIFMYSSLHSDDYENVNIDILIPDHSSQTSIKNLEHIKAEEEDTVKEITINNDTDNDEEIKNSAIEVTRVVENEHVLRKNVQHLNSTENIISEYDAAMTYKLERYSISKSEENLKIKTDDVSLNISSIHHCDITRDDSDINLKSETKGIFENEMKCRTQSDGHLIDRPKREKLNRRSSLVSSLKSGTFEWNFDYVSPYAMTEKQKQETLARKRRLHKRRKMMGKRKRLENERREQGNTQAFKNWKQRKTEEKLISSGRAHTASFAFGKSNRYMYDTHNGMYISSRQQN